MFKITTINEMKEAVATGMDFKEAFRELKSCINVGIAARVIARESGEEAGTKYLATVAGARKLLGR